MREPLQPYTGADRVNYLCILATEMMGLDSLDLIPHLLSGFDSISHTLHPDVACAVRTLRLSGMAPTTHRSLRLLVDAYLNAHRRRDRQEPQDRTGFDQRYEIDKYFNLRPRWATVVPADVTEAITHLSMNLPVKHKDLNPLHDPLQRASIRCKDDRYRGDVDPLGFMPPDVPVFDLRRNGRAPGIIRWQELIDTAERFDAKDEAAGKQEQGERRWYRRLHDLQGNPTVQLLAASASGLVPADEIDLTGIKHLIGLPGAGKTTLLYLLAACLAERDHRVCFLFPSIEVAMGFIETLEQHQVPAALLSGQGDSARTKHINNFATAVGRESNGYGVSRSASRFFATNCALAGFTGDEEEPFPHARPPCLEITQRTSAGERPQSSRCALAGCCARQHAERELIDARIWAGHVLSTDRGVSQLYAEFLIKHFEYIARTFDLVVVDECDGAQSDLDARGTPIMKLFGDENALWASLIHDLHQPIARGDNAFVAGKDIPSLVEMTGRFGQATNRLSACIQHLSAEMRKEYQGKLLTSLSLIADMYPYGGDFGNEEEVDAHSQARHGMERLWDAAAKKVAYRPSIKDDDDEITDMERELPEIAALLDTPLDEVEKTYEALHASILSWDIDADEVTAQEIAKVLRSIPGIRTPHDEARFNEYCNLLSNVSMVVMQHFGLAPHLHLLNSMDLVSENVFESRPSLDQLAILPESLTGKLSGIRYFMSEEGNVNISQVSVQGTPRRLFQRMHELGRENGEGAAILMTSATSLLEQSPRFHINEGPHYVLRRPNAGHGWKDSRYSFLPLPDPQQPGKMLRFSGASINHRDRVLTAMADRLLEGASLSRAHSVLAENDVVDGVGRKIGLVVNSYDQCQMLYDHIQSTHADWRGRVRYLRRVGGSGQHPHAVTASDVESLGADQHWDILVFPMNAIGRGVNIVYRFGPRRNKAMIGSLFFLTRPHPRQDDLGLIQGLVGRHSETFDKASFTTLDDGLRAMKQARMEAVNEAKYMLRLPLAATRLGQYIEPFVADQMIIILQTIGRAMRGDCPAFVYFVDAAWAPNSAQGQPDSARTSMLVMMQNILGDCLNHPDPVKRVCYENLYTSFAEPLSAISNLLK